MSLELKDLRCKVHPVTFAFLEAEGRSRGVDKCVVIRELLDNWAEIRRSAFMEAHKLLTAEGHIGAVQVIAGQSRAAAGGLHWDDE